jgi:5-methylcytosine-specific restriction endonuclease McrA
VLGKLFGERSVDFYYDRYRKEAAPLIQALKTVSDNHLRLDLKARALREKRQALDRPSFGRSKTASLLPSPVSRLKDQLKTFVFDLREVDIDRAQKLIAAKISAAEQERDIRHQKLEHTKARAAAYDNKQRQQAKSIRQLLRSQLTILPICPYCEAPLTLDAAHADHIYPVAKGGLSTRSNMVFICSSCNVGKGRLTLRTFIRKAGLDEEAVHENLEQLGKDF